MESVISFCLEHWLPLTAGLINFLWLYLEYKASIWLWPVGIILPFFYIAISWNALFLGNILVNAYYVITSIIGWIMWLRSHKTQNEGALNEEPSITHISKQEALTHLFILALLFYPMYWILKDNSSLPVADTLSTLFSFLGMIYLSRKRLEHWFCWIIANSLGVLIFYHAKDNISAVVFSINLVVSILGYIRWHKQLIASEANYKPQDTQA